MGPSQYVGLGVGFAANALLGAVASNMNVGIAIAIAFAFVSRRLDMHASFAFGQRMLTAAAPYIQ